MKHTLSALQRQNLGHACEVFNSGHLRVDASKALSLNAQFLRLGTLRYIVIRIQHKSAIY